MGQADNGAWQPDRAFNLDKWRTGTRLMSLFLFNVVPLKLPLYSKKILGNFKWETQYFSLESIYRFLNFFPTELI